MDKFDFLALTPRKQECGGEYHQGEWPLVKVRMKFSFNSKAKMELSQTVGYSPAGWRHWWLVLILL